MLSHSEHVLTVTAADEVIRLMKSGSLFIYYRGFLARDRDAKFSGNRARAAKVAALAEHMLKHGCEHNYALGEGTVVDGLGTGVLTQRRVNNGAYEYIFIKR